MSGTPHRSYNPNFPFHLFPFSLFSLQLYRLADCDFFFVFLPFSQWLLPLLIGHIHLNNVS